MESGLSYRYGFEGEMGLSGGGEGEEEEPESESRSRHWVEADMRMGFADCEAVGGQSQSSRRLLRISRFADAAAADWRWSRVEPSSRMVGCARSKRLKAALFSQLRVRRSRAVLAGIVGGAERRLSMKNLFDGLGDAASSNSTSVVQGTMAAFSKIKPIY